MDVGGGVSGYGVGVLVDVGGGISGYGWDISGYGVGVLVDVGGVWGGGISECSVCSIKICIKLFRWDRQSRYG